MSVTVHGKHISGSSHGESKQIIAYTEFPGGVSDMIFRHQQLSCSFSIVAIQNSANDLINIRLEPQAADVKFPCK